MIICKKCGTPNPDDALACEECMVLLRSDTTPKTQKQTVKKDSFLDKLSRRVEDEKTAFLSQQKEADIFFVFDCTGSMGGEIRAMQDALIDFAETVTVDGLNIRLGLIEFRDRTIGEEHHLHRFSDGVFTRHTSAFQSAVNGLRATGGGPAPESSPDALMLALEQPFRDCSNKTIVLITDAPPRIPDKETSGYPQRVIERMQERNINQYYVVTMLKNPKCLIHLQVLEGVQQYGGDGLAFDLAQRDDERQEHFKKVLRGLAKTISTKSIAI